MLRDSIEIKRPAWLGLLAAGVLTFPILSAAAPALGETNVDVRCQIRADENGGWFRLSGIATTDQAVMGHYRFRVSKRSASGSSDNVQSGRFLLEPGRETEVTTVYLDLGARNAYSAELVLDWDKGTRKCTAP